MHLRVTITIYSLFIYHEQVFEDAVEDVSLVKEKKTSIRLSKLTKKTCKAEHNGDVPLNEALEAAREAIDNFFNNRFDEARDIVEPL